MSSARFGRPDVQPRDLFPNDCQLPKSSAPTWILLFRQFRLTSFKPEFGEKAVVGSAATLRKETHPGPHVSAHRHCNPLSVTLSGPTTRRPTWRGSNPFGASPVQESCTICNCRDGICCRSNAKARGKNCNSSRPTYRQQFPPRPPSRRKSVLAFLSWGSFGCFICSAAGNIHCFC